MRRAFLLVAMFLVGCGGPSVGFVSTKEWRLTSSTGRAEWLTSAPPYPYREVGVLEGIGHGSRDDVIKKLVRRAGEEGCNALVEVPLLAPTQSCGPEPVHVRGVCIVAE